MNLLLDIKICIASFDVEVWLKLYMVDKEVRNYTLQNTHFHTLFQRQSKIYKCELMLIQCHLDGLYHLCRVTSLSCGGRGSCRKYHYVGRCVFTNKLYEMLIKKDDVIYVYK